MGYEFTIEHYLLYSFGNGICSAQHGAAVDRVAASEIGVLTLYDRTGPLGAARQPSLSLGTLRDPFVPGKGKTLTGSWLAALLGNFAQA